MTDEQLVALAIFQAHYPGDAEWDDIPDHKHNYLLAQAASVLSFLRENGFLLTTERMDTMKAILDAEILLERLSQGPRDDVPGGRANLSGSLTYGQEDGGGE